MNTFLRVNEALAAGAFGVLVLMAVIGHWLETRGWVRPRANAGPIAKLTSFGLFLVLGYSLLPLLLHVFVVAQGRIGNADVGLVRGLREHERGAVFAFWGLFTAGLLVALPVMAKDFFSAVSPALQPLIRPEGGAGTGRRALNALDLKPISKFITRTFGRDAGLKTSLPRRPQAWIDPPFR